MTQTTTHITTSGGLISAAFIEQIREADAQMRGLAPATFAWPGRPPARSRADVEARIAAAWERTLERWDAIHAEVHAMDVSTVRQRWLLPLFGLLDFEPTYLRGDVVLDEAGRLRYPLSHRGWPDDGPILHTVAPTQDLDARADPGRGIKAKSPHDMLQAFLNASGGQRHPCAVGWAVLSNGIFLRLLREYHHTFTKGYVQFDLEAICETRNYGDFRALFRMAHASRFTPPSFPPASRGEARGCPLEQFYADSLATGIKVGDDLREQVREAIETLGNGFLATSPDLLHRLQGDDALIRRYYAEILHIIYRVLFLLFAEQRGMMPGRDSLYVETYAIAALRARAERELPGGAMTAGASFGHTDLWEGLKVTFKMVREGAPDLGVTQYNGMLFAADQTPLIGAPRPSTLRNGDLLRAIRALTLIEREGVLQRISYADLGVEELGSIYESLLEYTPRITREREVIAGREIPPYTFVLDPRGSERKTTGSYYTHPSLVNALIESALLPVARARLAAAGLPVAEPTEAAGPAGLLEDVAALTPHQREAAEAALLDLKICDPAAGSGHFLVKADNVLGAELARIRSGDAYPTEAQIQAAKRDVLAHCLYAVDLNPMAVELCKVSLWINASVRDRPLNFLDHHIKCGNSLVGATPDLLAEGVPYEAFALGRAGDDRDLAKQVRKQNRQERREYEKAHAVQLAMQFEVTHVLETPEDVARWAALTRLAEMAPQRARERYTAYQTDEKTAHARLVADTWTAAFFWPLTPAAPDPPTFDTFYQVREKGRDALTEDQQRMVAALAEKHRFLHWRLTFPDVFTSPHPPTAEGNLEGTGGSVERSGFDVILGNPPWERIKVQEKEFFADKAPDIANARTAAQRRRLIKRLPESDPALHAAYIDALRGSEALSTYLRESGRYPLSAAGDINTYQIFAGLVRQIVDGRGRVGIVVPTGIATDYYNQDYFAALIDNRELASLYDFENRAKLFPGVDSRYKFSLLTLTAAPAAEAEFAFFLHQVDDLADDARRFALSAEDLARINPNTKTCPIFRTRRDAELTAKLYRAAPVLVNEAEGTNPWDASFLRMFDMTNDSDLFHTRADLETQGFELEGNRFVRGDEVYLPLYEGKMFMPFDHRFANVIVTENVGRSGQPEFTTLEDHLDPDFVPMPRFWVLKSEVKSQIAQYPFEWLVGFKNVTAPTNERTFLSTILPLSGVGNSVPLILPLGNLNSMYVSCLVGDLTSFTFDFVVRQKMGNVNLNFYIVEQLPVLPPETYTPDHLRYIVPRVLELTYTAWDLRPFADDVWREAQGHPSLMRALLDQWEANRQATQAYPREAPFIEPGWPRPPFTWDERRRSQLRADLDGLYAHLYHLTREELAYILETFPIVKRKDEARWGAYRTKRLVLAAYDAALGLMSGPLQGASPA